MVDYPRKTAPGGEWFSPNASGIYNGFMKNVKNVKNYIGGAYRNRTDVHGFAIRCITTLPTRHV